MIPNPETSIPPQNTFQQSHHSDDCEQLDDSDYDDQIESNQSQPEEIQSEVEIQKNDSELQKGETDFIGPLKSAEKPIAVREEQDSNEKCTSIQRQYEDEELLRPQLLNDEKIQEWNKECVNRNNQRNFQYHQDNRDFKIAQMKFASRLIYAAFYLLRNEFRKKINPKLGRVQLNPYESNNSVKILYYDDCKKEELMDKVEQMMENIQEVPLSKADAESGVQMSRKFMITLQKQNITIYRDTTQNFFSSSYYICGNVANQKILRQKISEIRKMKFLRVYINKYKNTRSYRAIVRKIYETPEMKQFIKQNFKALQIQVARIYNGFQKIQIRGVMTLLTFMDGKILPHPSQIEGPLTSFIQQKYSIFCFPFTYKKQNFKHKYVPKTQNVCWFFIEESNSVFSFTYLFIIINNASFEEAKIVIIKEIEAMKLQIFGRRFFKNLWPIMHENANENHKYRTFYFPKVNPYSWTIKSKKGKLFDWKAQLHK